MYSPTFNITQLNQMHWRQCPEIYILKRSLMILKHNNASATKLIKNATKDKRGMKASLLLMWWLDVTQGWKCGYLCLNSPSAMSSLFHCRSPASLQMLPCCTLERKEQNSKEPLCPTTRAICICLENILRYRLEKSRGHLQAPSIPYPSQCPHHSINETLEGL